MLQSERSCSQHKSEIVEKTGPPQTVSIEFPLPDRSRVSLRPGPSLKSSLVLHLEHGSISTGKAARLLLRSRHVRFEGGSAPQLRDFSSSRPVFCANCILGVLPVVYCYCSERANHTKSRRNQAEPIVVHICVGCYRTA